MKVILAFMLLTALVFTSCSPVMIKIDEEMKDIKEELRDVKEDLNDLPHNIREELADALPPQPVQLSEEQMISAVTPHIKAFGEVISENFGSEIDIAGVCYAAYPEKNIDGIVPGELDDDEKVILVKDPDVLPDGYQIDGTYTSYIPVINYTDEDEAEERFSSLMNDDIFEDALDENFEEYKGKLYLVRGGRGYGAASVDVSSAEVVAVTGSGCTVKVKRLLFDEPDGEYFLNFKYTDNGFFLTDVKNYYVGNAENQ